MTNDESNIINILYDYYVSICEDDISFVKNVRNARIYQVGNLQMGEYLQVQVICDDSGDSDDLMVEAIHDIRFRVRGCPYLIAMMVWLKRYILSEKIQILKQTQETQKMGEMDMLLHKMAETFHLPLEKMHLLNWMEQILICIIYPEV